MSAAASILIVDDDEPLTRRLSQHLAGLGYGVTVASTAHQARQAVRQRPPDVVLLDWNLPDSDGLQLLAHWRNQGVNLPVLMLSANVSTAHRVSGLRAGADDYLIKPFDVSELLARLDALLRRSAPASGPRAAGVSFGPYRFDVAAARLERHDQPFALAAGELALLLAFARHPNRVLERDRLLQLLGDPFGDRLARSVDLRVARLRERLADPAEAPQWIVTVRGQGYRLDARVEDIEDATPAPERL